jgi:H+/Cl- antiporter ClcA
MPKNTKKSKSKSKKNTSANVDITPTVSKDTDDEYGAVVDIENDIPIDENGDDYLPPAGRALTKTQSNSFLEDLSEFNEGTIPQSMVVALTVGITCGIAAWIYYTLLWGILEYLWHTFPQTYIEGHWPECLYVLWIPIVGFTMAVGLGLTVKYIGEPGDLAYTIKCVHEKAYISMSHVMPMVVASQFSILGGGSLGPEAPLVAICASIGGWVSRTVFKRKNRNVVRKHTLMGMAGALAAFFGCPLGGSLFALEVNSRFGVEYFEHMVEAIFCGEVTLAVFRALSGLPIAPIWTIEKTALTDADPQHVIYGAIIGLLGAGVATIFAHFHWAVMDQFKKYDLLDNNNAVQRALVGAVVVVLCGMLVPQTMFWGEYEFQTISTMSEASDLRHVWPTTGLFGFQMQSTFHAFIVGFVKMIAISFTVAGGYRGGFIFPFFAAGAAFGNVISAIFPFVPVPLACLAFAAGINVAITRTSLATPLILCFLAGEQNCMTGVLTASLVSLFATGYMPFIKSQITRSDMQYAMYYGGNEEPDIEPEEDEHQYMERMPLKA